MLRKIIGIACILSFTTARGQEAWDLQKCVEYALANNISVKQADLQTRFAQLDYTRSKASRLPSLNFGSNAGYSLGRRENPTTGVLEDQNFFSTNFNLQSGVSLFNWFSLKNATEAARLTIEANREQYKKVQNDVALNVAVAYLQILLARQQAAVSSVQVATTQVQLDVTRKKIAAGVLPELNGAELEAQLARDSAALITGQANVQNALLLMKALLNLDAAQPFDVVAPPVGMIPVENIADLQPEAVYQSALTNLPQQKVNDLQIQAAQKNVASARGNMYPSISAYANLGTNYIFYRQPNYARVLKGYDTTTLRVNNGGSYYVVEAPNLVQGSRIGYITPDNFPNQLNANFGQGVGLSLQVPIFNGRAARTNWERAKLNVNSLQLQKEQDRMTLKQDIYTAYTDAATSMQTYSANRKSVEAAEKAFNFAQKRYNANLISTYELLNSQNNLARARIDMLYAQFNYVFKMKLLEFYKGQGIRL